MAKLTVITDDGSPDSVYDGTCLAECTAKWLQVIASPDLMPCAMKMVFDTLASIAEQDDESGDPIHATEWDMIDRLELRYES